MSPSTGLIACEQCGETFLRKEHRDRHALRHSGLKPFRCDICNRAFPRRDSLLRHWTNHHSQGDLSENNRRAAQACIRCARLKQRCEGGRPCRRCMRQNSLCEYRPDRILNEEGVQALQSTDVGDVDSGSQATQNYSDVEQHTAISTETATHPDFSPQASWYRPAEMNQPLVIGNPTELTPPMSHESWNIDNGSAISSLPSVLDLHEPTFLDFVDAGRSGFAFLSANTVYQCPPLDLFHAEAVTCDGQPHQLPGNTPSSSHPINESQMSIMGASRDANHATSLSECPFDPLTLSPRKHLPCLEFPPPPPDLVQATQAEMFGHVAMISDYHIEPLHIFYTQQRGCEASPFISTDVLHAFVELYLEYFDPKFPFLHHTKLRGTGLHWVVLVAVAAIGSQYSAIPAAKEYGLVLQDLLSRALRDHAIQNKGVDTAFVQSLFLRHVLLFFSGSKSFHVMLQWERSMLVDALKNRAHHDDLNQRSHDKTDRERNEDWRAWLLSEEKARLIHCVHALECLEYVFLDQPPLFNLADLVQDLPCNESLWQCQTAMEWRQCLNQSSDSPACQPVANAQSALAQDSSQLMTFAMRTYPLELYVDDRLRGHHMRSSRRLQSMYVREDVHGDGILNSPQVSFETSSIVDKVIDEQAYAKLGRIHTQDLLIHVLAILRHVPLVRLYHAIGWQTDKAEMEKSRSCLAKILQKDRKTARRCLWHATTIFTKLRNARHFACYDTLNLCVAVCFLWLFAKFGKENRDQSRLSSIMNPVGPKTSAVRVDKLAKKEDVREWILAGDDTEVYITGIGCLQGPNSHNIVLRDAVKILTKQTTWSGLCQSLAKAFARIKNDEMVDLDSE
ncbi:hypothetical protein PFICI_10814 [Pestalotiopsis fici W106-1]|uniref:Uncharacterized protein n=1 Tax=Pestalotiopsis fici (strain W106-1 / CGMCC3.15140) TaxID=1229662 RepID=W3WSV2_PESFW|nr:uncharacterized protein PFICI_10814 [Pestalotiopsis fici W106-1]ETS76940.1 hypothetical protein PFICI_10814 [Pestalotiopsis fici W106-1]